MAHKKSRMIKLRPLADQVLIITGASSGVGLVTARTAVAAVAAGAAVVLVARNAEALAVIVDELVNSGGRAIWREVDVGDETGLRNVANDAIRDFGRIDCWINVAGAALYAKPSEVPDDAHRRLFDTNYFGVVHGCRVALPLLRDRGGALITVASTGADVPSLLMGVYNASKHAVKGYVGALRMEVAAEDLPVSVTLIKPAGINTPIVDHTTSFVQGKARIPAPYDPQVVADAILFAAVHPVREVTVGGRGKLHTLIGQLFPKHLEHQARSESRAMVDLGKEQPQPGNLFGTVRAGSERSGQARSKSYSFYTAVALRPKRSALGFTGLAVVMATLGLHGLKGREVMRHKVKSAKNKQNIDRV